MKNKNPSSCGNSCRFGSPGGMATNGACHCLDELPTEKRVKVAKGIRFLIAEVNRLEEKLEDWEKTYRTVMDEECSSDEKHCTCVPPLRKEILQLKFKELTEDATKTEKDT